MPRKAGKVRKIVVDMNFYQRSILQASEKT